MKTQVISANDKSALDLAIEILNKDGTVAFPTDTVYGLGAMVFQPKGIERLYQIKERDHSLSIPVLLGQAEDIEIVADNPGQAVYRLAGRFWPGPLTLVIPRRSIIPKQIGPTPTIGVRIPNHPVALNLLQNTGPMAVTSANLSGGENAHTANKVFEQLDGRVDLILDGGMTPGGVPSTVVQMTGADIKILRAGPISEGEIRGVLRDL